MAGIGLPIRVELIEVLDEVREALEVANPSFKGHFLGLPVVDKPLLQSMTSEGVIRKSMYCVKGKKFRFWGISMTFGDSREFSVVTRNLEKMIRRSLQQGFKVNDSRVVIISGRTKSRKSNQRLSQLTRGTRLRGTWMWREVDWNFLKLVLKDTLTRRVPFAEGPGARTPRYSSNDNAAFSGIHV